MRRILVGGLMGAIPGLSIVLVPLLLHEFGAISADQSQIGFIGVPLLVAGLAAGALVAAGPDRVGKVGAGLAAGLVVGVVLGLLVGQVLTAAGLEFPLTWLVAAPVGMIVGAMLGARRDGGPKVRGAPPTGGARHRHA